MHMSIGMYCNICPSDHTYAWLCFFDWFRFARNDKIGGYYRLDNRVYSHMIAERQQYNEYKLKSNNL